MFRNYYTKVNSVEQKKNFPEVFHSKFMKNYRDNEDNILKKQSIFNKFQSYCIEFFTKKKSYLHLKIFILITELNFNQIILIQLY